MEIEKAQIKEKKQHGTGWVPYSYYACCISDYFSGVPLHWHDEFEINYILHGQGEFIFGEERFKAKDGDIVIATPGLLHAIFNCEKTEVRYETIVFKSDMLGTESQDRSSSTYIHPIVNGTYGISPHITPDTPYYEELHSCVITIVDCAKSNKPMTDLLMKSALLRLFYLLWDSGCVTARDNKSKLGEVLRPVLKYIKEHLSEPLTITQLARYAHMSESYFMEMFKQVAGMSAMAYVNQLRIRHICELLRSTTLTVSQIALDNGFRNLANFNRQFKRMMGCTPQEYRRLNSNMQEQKYSLLDKQILY